MESFFSKNESCKRKRNARRVNNALRIKLPFLSLYFLVYFPLRAVLLERLLDRGDRSSLLQREDVFFGRFPVVQLVVLLGHFISLLIKPLLFQSAKTKRRREKNDRRHFSCRQSRGQSVCACVFARACDNRNVMNSEVEKSSNFCFPSPQFVYSFRVLVHPFLLESKK